MSYDASRESGCRAIQMDIAAAVKLSQDFTQRTIESITANAQYFIESRKYVVTDTNLAGLILYRNWANFTWAGATIRCNSTSTGSTTTDESYFGANQAGVSFTTTSAQTGMANISSQTHINTFWRLS